MQPVLVAFLLSLLAGPGTGLGGRTAYLAAWALFSFTLIGTFFSIYLTFLEPFVIGATCAWCLTSAIIMTLLLWLSADRHRLADRVE